MQKGHWVLKGLAFLLSGFLVQYSVAQSLHDEVLCPAKTPAQLKKAKQKKELLKAANRALVYISYLNYSDRTVDRVFTGAKEYEPYSGMHIRHVDVRILEPFGVTIERPTADSYKRFAKFANSIQFKTKEWAIRNELLFHPGDAVNPMLISDTERNLWDRGSFKDIKIFMLPVDGTDDQVDIVIIVQERWSWSISTSAQYNKAVIGVEFDNFLGKPQSVYQKISVNYRKDNPYTIYGGYEYDNIKKTHIDVSGEYQYENLTTGGDVEASRRFYSINSQLAFDVHTGIYHELASVPNALAAAIPTNIFYNYQDVWLAESFKTILNPLLNSDMIRVIVSGRYYRNDYMSRPYMISPDSTQMFINHSFFLGSIGIANWNYYVDHSVYSLGNAEYFPKGVNATIIAGIDNDEELGKRFYSSFQINDGSYIKGIGYLNTKLAYGTFADATSFNQMLLKLSSKFFSAPIDMGRHFFMREFFNTSFNIGFNRPADRELAVNDGNGFRGVFVNYIRGGRSYIFNYETDIYPKFKVLGFSSTVFAFANIALVQQASEPGTRLCQGYGAGLRVRSLSLGVGFFEISFVYYPNIGIAGFKPYTIIGTTDNNRGIGKDNLFIPGILTPDSY